MGTNSTSEYVVSKNKQESQHSLLLLKLFYGI